MRRLIVEKYSPVTDSSLVDVESLKDAVGKLEKEVSKKNVQGEDNGILKKLEEIQASLSPKSPVKSTESGAMRYAPESLISNCLEIRECY